MLCFAKQACGAPQACFATRSMWGKATGPPVWAEDSGAARVRPVCRTKERPSNFSEDAFVFQESCEMATYTACRTGKGRGHAEHYGTASRSFFVPGARCQALKRECLALQAQRFGESR